MNDYLLPSGRKRILLLGLFVLLMLLVACQESQPTATPAEEVVQATSPPRPTTRPSPSPTETPIPTATAAPSPTATATARPSPTPRPELVVLVQDEDGQPVAGALVRLVGAILARRTAGDDGRVTFMAPRSGQYRVEVTAEGYADHAEEVEIADGPNALAVVLQPAATPTAEAPAAPESPPTPAPVGALPPAAQPSGPNLLVNPGFEYGGDGWGARFAGPNAVKTYTLNDFPQFVHSGAQAAEGAGLGYYQQVSGVTPGTTYRFTIWAKMWSSTGDDRTVSENPDPNAAMVICLNTNGEDDRWSPASVCSPPARPLDVWQNLAVDAVAGIDKITVIMYGWSSTRVVGFDNETLWDDAYLGLAPFAATPTPAPAGPPAPPAAVAFEASALRDSMLGLQNALVQTGGLLDRLYNGQAGSCREYEGYYRQIVESQPYHSVPADWQGIYNEYAWAAEHGRATNEAIYSLCAGGGGILTELNYGVARTGINESLDRLNPAIDATNSLLGQ